MVDINHKQNIGQAAHFLDTTQADFELVEITLAGQSFFFGEFRKSTVGGLNFKVTQTLD